MKSAFKVLFNESLVFMNIWILTLIQEFVFLQDLHRFFSQEGVNNWPQEANLNEYVSSRQISYLWLAWSKYNSRVSVVKNTYVSFPDLWTTTRGERLPLRMLTTEGSSYRDSWFFKQKKKKSSSVLWAVDICSHLQIIWGWISKKYIYIFNITAIKYVQWKLYNNI